MPPIKTIGKVFRKEKLTETVWLIEIEFVNSATFLPGQYVSLKVDELGTRRSYSVAKFNPGKSFELLIDISPMGIGSKFVLNMNVGDMIEVLGFLGRFVVLDERDSQNSRVLFVATGTGVAPFGPMISDLLLSGYGGKVSLLWGLRHETDLYWQEFFGSLAAQKSNFDFGMVLSKPTQEWNGKTGHVGDYILANDGDWSKTRIYICGLPAMIDEVRNKLIGLNVREENIIFERFS